MRWYDGPIENAVGKVKTTGSFLLVFVQGNDNLSKKYESCLNEVKGLKDETFVALKVTRDSTALDQFKQIYVKVPIPSVFLIGNNGIPYSVIATDKISEICSAISKTVVNVTNKLENKTTVTVATKKNLEELPLKPLEEPKNVGRKVADVSEGELKQRLKEIRAFPRFLLIDPTSNLDPPPPPPPPLPVPLPPRQPPKTQSARIQFRLPNNETPSWEFPDLSTLRDVRAYLTEKVRLPRHFKFMRSYPRTAFTGRDERKTLLELALTPNATLIVVPVKLENKMVQADSGDAVSRPHLFSVILNTLLVPLMSFIKFFKKQIFGERAEAGHEEEEEEEANGGQVHANVPKIRTPHKFATNIHGFKFDRDDSDGEHPDNGNSTQQSYHKK